MASIASLSVKIGTDIQAFTNDLNDLVKQANKAASEIEKKFKGLSSLGRNLSSVGTEMAKAFTLPIAALAGFAVSARADMQKLEMGLDAITGNAAETAKQLARLKEIAKLPGLSLEDATKATINLQSVGVEATRSERFIKGFGNALALVGKGASDLNPVISQLVQMSTKTKVVAGDLRPIMDAVPQVAGIIKKHFGTIDTEALQKMGVSTQEFTNVVLEGLERLPKAGQGIGNSFENLKDTVRNTFSEIGKSLEGPTTFVIDRLATIVEGIQKLVVKFQALPDPAKAAIGSFITLAAALGPIMIGFGQLAQIGPAIVANLARVGKVFGVGAGAVVGWGLAIAAAVAALVALGTWVYQNWEPIKAVVMTAWQGVSELWDAHWKVISKGLEDWWKVIKAVGGALLFPFAKSLETIWNAIGPIFRSVWSSIANLLGSLWTAITNHATFMFEGIKKSFNAFIGWAKANIPGAAKLLSLSDVWSAEQKKLAATNALNEAKNKSKTTSDSKFSGGTGSDPLKDAMSLFGVHEQASLAQMQKALALIKQQFDAGKISAADYTSALSKMAEATWLAEHPATALQIATMKLGVAAEKELQPLRDAEAALKSKAITQVAVNTKVYECLPVFQMMREKLLQIAEAAYRSQTAMKGLAMMKAGAEALLKPYNDLAARIKELGVITTAEATKRYEVTQKALEDARAMNDQLGVEMYSRRDLLKLQYEALRAKEVSIGLSEQEKAILIDLHKTVDTSNRSVIDGIEKTKKPLQEVSTILTNMSQRIGDAIVNWRGFGDLAISTLKSIGSAIISEIVTNLMKSTDLIGKVTKGLSGVLSKIPGLGGIFGGGAKAATTTAADAAGGVSGMLKNASSSVQSSIGKVASSLTSTLTAVGSIGSMISGIVGNFQSMAMNKTLDLIEKEVRYSQIHLRYILEKQNEFLPNLAHIHQRLIEMLNGGMSLSPTAAGAAAGNGNNLTININGGNFYGIDDIADSLARTLRLRGLI